MGYALEKNDNVIDLELYPKQQVAFHSEASEILFGGATRGGKSHFVRVFLIAACLSVPGLQCVIIRRVLEDVVANHMVGPSSFKSMLRPLIEGKRATVTNEKVTFFHDNGEPDSTIILTHCRTEEAAEKAQGIPKDICVFEEACQIRERHIRFIRAWVTSTEEIKNSPFLPPWLKGRLPIIVHTANPIGASVGYYRRNFVKPAPNGVIFQAPKDDGGFKRVYIEAKVDDNPSEDTEATIARVSGMGDEGYIGALIDANWDSPIGDFFKEYDDAVHCVPDFIPPKAWQKGSFLTFDWGSEDPFAVGWWCVSDGREFKHGLKTMWFPRGSLIMYREWYGCKDQGNPGKGLHLPNYLIARGIVERTQEETSGAVLTDSFPFNAKGTYKGGREYTIADEFAEEGVLLTRANTQRVYGWKQVRDRLKGRDGIPLLYFAQSCVYTRDYLPMLGYHEGGKREDAQEHGEATHCSDMVRYGCTTNPLVYDNIEPDTEFRKPKPKTAGSIAKLIQRKNRRYG